MANAYGYPVLQTDLAGLWETGGQVTISDGYGSPSFTSVPSGIVRSVKRNSTGNYSIVLQEAWFALINVDIKSAISTATYIGCQIRSSTVGNKAVLPVQAGGVGQQVTFQFNTSGTPTELPSGSSFLFLLTLKQSSA